MNLTVARLTTAAETTAANTQVVQCVCRNSRPHGARRQHDGRRNNPERDEADHLIGPVAPIKARVTQAPDDRLSRNRNSHPCDPGDDHQKGIPKGQLFTD